MSVRQGTSAPQVSWWRLGFVMLGVATLLVLIASLVIYTVSLYFENRINTVGRETWELDEMNKQLQVRVNQIQSFESISTLAGKVPRLHQPDDTIEIRDTGSIRLASVPNAVHDYPYVYGY